MKKLWQRNIERKKKQTKETENEKKNRIQNKKENIIKD